MKVPRTERNCSRCKVRKSLDQFYKGAYSCKECSLRFHKEWVKANPAKAYAHKLKDTERIRENVRNQYGRKCAKCGFDNVRALQIDHIKGGGLEEKRRIGTIGIYRRALRFPLEYQLLCANCNILKLYNEKEHIRRYDVIGSS